MREYITDLPQYFKSWRHFGFRLASEMLSAGAARNVSPESTVQTIPFLQVGSWRKYFIDEPAKIITNQGFFKKESEEYLISPSRSSRTFGDQRPVELYDNRSVFGKNSLFVSNTASMNDKHPIKGLIFNTFPSWIDPGRPNNNNPVLLLNITGIRSDRNPNMEEKRSLKGPFRTELFKVKEIGIWAANSNTKRLDWNKFDRNPNLRELSEEMGLNPEAGAEEVFNAWRDKVEKRSNREKTMLICESALEKALQGNNISRGFFEEKVNIQKRLWGIATNVAWLLMATSFFAKINLDVIFFSEAPETPINILESVYFLKKRIPRCWAESCDVNLPQVADWIMMHEILEKPIVWILPRTHLDKTCARIRFRRLNHDDVIKVPKFV